MKVIVFGGDGFCGWPTSLYLSKKGYKITIVDNLSRRNIDNELGCSSLTPIKPMDVRIKAWKELTNQDIEFINLDLANDYENMLALLCESKPDVVIHFAEQRSAPYSMKSSRHKRYTVSNNVNATNNLLSAIVESGLDIHVIHLGTMGVYGYGTTGMKIPEGYLKIKVDTEEGGQVENEILYPVSPGSIYHMTKTQDQLMFSYYNSNDLLRITDLHQGIVWGTQTDETKLDERLINRFDYDGDYGTVLNRFMMQAAINYPLSVHGTGGQARAFININDTVKCIDIAIRKPPSKGEKVKIYNQMTEVHKVRELAKMVSEMAHVPINYITNPRNEASENDLCVDNALFIKEGLMPITLESGLLEEIKDIARKYAHRCDMNKIPCKSLWTKSMHSIYQVVK